MGIGTFVWFSFVVAGASAYSVLPLGYDGSYVTEIHIDGRSFPVLVDTGSSNLVVPAQICLKCSTADTCMGGIYNDDCNCPVATATTDAVACPGVLSCPQDSGKLVLHELF